VAGVEIGVNWSWVIVVLLVLRAGRLEGLLSVTDVSRLVEVQRLRLSGLPRSASAVSTVPATRGRA
jgi:hypothetical protein